MADSVGKIQLDLEINPISIAQEMSSLSKTFSSSMKSTFSRMGGFVKESMSKMASSFRSMVPGETKQASSELSEQIESLTVQMDNASNQAEMYRQRLKDLAATYGMLDKASMQGEYGTKLQEEMLKTEERMLRYGDRSNRLRLEIEKLEQATAQLGETTAQAGATTEKAGRQLAQTGTRAHKAQRRVNNFATTLHRAFTRVLRQIFIIAVLYKVIRGMIDYVKSALATNKEFVHSLNQVKANLQVAFMPIYQTVLPALQSLMHWLAVATTYIAAFTTALFGKSYKESFAAAQGLNEAKKNMEGYGKAAKKTLGALAGFDEINVLTMGKGAEAGGAAEGLEPPPIDTDLIESDMQGLADRIKSFLASIFEPIKAAWAKEGAATMDAARYALGGILALVKEIGKSFAEVWTGGTGQAILETFLRILQNIFGLIGDISYTFANIWAEGGRGTAIIQGIANIFLHLLELVERITESLRNVWGIVGETVARTFLDIIGATVGILENLAEKLLWVWDHGGKHLFESLLILGAKIFELAGYIYTEFVAPFVNWFIDMIAPAIATVLDWAGWLLDKFIELIDWLMGDGRPVLDKIGTVLGSIAVAFGVVTAAVAIWNGLVGIATAATAVFGAAIAFLTSPIGIAILIIAGIIAILKHFGVTFEDVKNLVKRVIDAIVGFFQGFYDKLVGHSIIPDLINAIVKWFTGLIEWVTVPVTKLVEGVVKLFQQLLNNAKKIFNNIKDVVTGIVNAIKSIVLTTWNSIVSGVKKAFSSIYTGASDIFNRLKNFIKGVCDSISGFFKGMVNGVIRGLNSMIGGLNKLNFSVPDWIPGIGGKSLGFSLSRIPELARGGIVDQPTLAMIGERRKKEAIVPLENTAFVDKLAAAVRDAVMAAMQSGGINEPDQTIVVKIGEDTIVEKVVSGINRRSRLSGETVILA